MEVGIFWGVRCKAWRGNKGLLNSHSKVDHMRKNKSTGYCSRVSGDLWLLFFFCQWDHQSPSVNWKESWQKEATWLCSASHPLAQSPLCIPGSESRRRRERMNVCLPNLRLVSHLFYWSMETTGQSVLSQWILNLVWWAPHKDLEYTTEPHCFYFSHLTGNRKICLFFP